MVTEYYLFVAWRNGITTSYKRAVLFEYRQVHKIRINVQISAPQWGNRGHTGAATERGGTERDKPY